MTCLRARFAGLVLMSLAASCASGPAVTDPPDESQVPIAGHLRGYDAIEQIVRDRLIARGSPFTLAPYLDSTGEFLSTLVPLLGVQGGDGLRSGLINVSPNSLNVLLWNVTLGSLAADVARHCGASGTTLPMNAPLAAVVRFLCDWPLAQPAGRTALEALWLVVMAHDAPQDEMAAFVDFFSGPEYSVPTAADALRDLLTAIFMNPNFLLER